MGQKKSKKLMPSLLAIAVFQAMCCTDALALSINGKTDFTPDASGQYIIDYDVLQGAGSHKFVIAQGDKIVITKPGNVNALINTIDKKDFIGSLRQALTEQAVVGVVGGEGDLDSGTMKGLSIISSLAPTLGGFAGEELKPTLDLLGSVAEKLQNVDTAKDKHLSGNTFITVGAEDRSPVVVGVIGGDLGLDTGLSGSANMSILGNSKPIISVPENNDNISIVRDGSSYLKFDNGNVFGAVGGSAAVAVGNITASGTVSFKRFASVSSDLTFAGESSTTLTGSVNTAINGKTNVGGLFNGGLAMGIGGTATSTVGGDSYIDISSDVNIDGAIDGITVGIAGGGAAISTIGGEATSTVEGSTKITINNGMSLGVIGGGTALAADATGLVEFIATTLQGKPNSGYDIGNDNGTSDKGILELLNKGGGSAENDIMITVDDAIQGGTATAKTGDTKITLSGNTTAIGVLGGGMAVTSHTYKWKEDGTNTADLDNYKAGDAYGSSNAKAENGKATIVVNVSGDSSQLWQAASDFAESIASGGSIDLSSLDAFKGAGAVIGLAGGGVAFAHGDPTSNFDANGTQGSFAQANTSGADIHLASGYAVGVFGGGLALTMNNASAQANMTDDVNINVYDGMKVVGLFGNGFAYFTGSSNGGKNNLTGMAEATANDIAINVSGGTVDGIVGGGLAIDDSQADKTNAKVTSEQVTINVSGGEINVLQFAPLKTVAGAVDEILGQNESEGPNWDKYVTAVETAAKDIAIAAGGVAVGGGANTDVTTAVVNIDGGTIKGDIIAGGISVYGFGTNNTEQGSFVGTSTINLNGGVVEGDIYAGGVSVNTGDSYNQAKAAVDTAVINWNGADVKGALVGYGYKVTGADTKTANQDGTSTLNIIGTNTLSLPVDVGNDGTETQRQNESKIYGFDNINIKADSVTVLEDLEAGNTTALIDADGTKVTTEDGALLKLTELKTSSDKSYLIASNTEENAFWGDDDLLYDRTEAFAQTNTSISGDYTISYKDLTALSKDEEQEAVDSFVGSLGRNGHHVRNLVDEVITNGDNINDGAKQYFSDVSTGGQALSSGMMLFAEAAGVTSNSISIASDMADNSVRRLSFIEDNIVTEPKVNENGALWLRYIHTTNDLEGMDSSLGGIDSDSDFDGVTLGADLMRFGNFQAGLAFSYGQGESDGSGIDNDVDMWGVNAYGSYKLEQINFIADLGYSQSDNELEGYVNGKKVTGERDVSIITAGLRAEAQFTFDNLQVVPYAGLRYYSVDPDDYTSKYDGKDTFHYDSDRLNLWTLPIGVSLRAEFETAAGFKIIPQVETAFIWAFGDNEDNALDVSMGTGASSTLEYSVMDTGSWLGKVGLEMAYKSFDFGFGYSYQKGSDAEDDMLYVNAEYTF